MLLCKLTFLNDGYVFTMAFRRLKDLPCNISRNISLRLHPLVYNYLKEEAAKRTLNLGIKVSIGDIIRETLKDKKGDDLISENDTVETPTVFYQADFFSMASA